MEIINKYDFKLKRRKLFLFVGTGVAGYILNKLFPFHFAGKKLISPKLDVIVKLNPKAVSRNKTGKNNV
jgi:hypothetical protein